MRRHGKKGIRSNKAIRATRDNTYTDRHFFTYGNVDDDNNGRIFRYDRIHYSEVEYCTLCGERVHCKGIIHERNTRIRDKNYTIEKRREKNHYSNEDDS
jgi:hypothetical protein